MKLVIKKNETKLIFTLLATLFTVKSWADCPEGLVAFEKTLHKKLISNCTMCHSSGPLPQHSNKDAKVAYSVAKKYANFNSMDDSIFYKKVLEKHWLKYGGLGIDMSESIIIKELTNWYEEGEKKCQQTFEYITQVNEVPNDLPRSEKDFKKLRWPLDSIGSNFKSATLELEGQIFSQNDKVITYRFRNPRVHAPFPLELKGIRPVINGQMNLSENAFADLSKIIPASLGEIARPELPVPSANLSLANLFISSRGTGKQYLAFTFGQISRVQETKGCRDLDGFGKIVIPLIQNNACLSCHGDPLEVAHYHFPMDVSNHELCEQIVVRSQPVELQSSVFLGYPLQGQRNHVQLSSFDARTFRKEIEKWQKSQL